MVSKEIVGPKLEVDCGPLTASLFFYERQGLPGAHVLAVVPAHRGTYAEVRGRCWLQISSRNALQKQRQTRVNGSLGDSLFRDFLGARVIEEASRLQAAAGKGRCKEARPRVAS